MSALWAGVLIGVGAWFVVGLAICAVVDGDTREALVKVLAAPAALPLIFTVGYALRWALRLPKFTRCRVTAESLRNALDDDRYEHRTDAVNWPGGALVLLRSKPAPPERVDPHAYDGIPPWAGRKAGEPRRHDPDSVWYGIRHPLRVMGGWFR